ncbi:LLM class flavin-dependent oxidoreductase [Salinicoccus halitifaciens]|uniref:Luciferase family oxidoreductase group 1 n=1 Tax=Salinicoccus halitifaciens TaxID=1073415 RepID=A0ABV2E7M9_9STAP|nr:LLM class flavin-dependent oxidoreductase [Salinicoccus halitifaciens]MCD2136629.1 LLM class flavin-dependent oxidoreductase [Salinicoccus halitifaciens]
MIKLNVLDYAVVDEGRSPAEALYETAALCKKAEALGYHRFWIAEHHDVSAFASSSPEMLMMHLLGQTDSIRLGSGGVMIPHYSPLKVAENFRMLETLHPGRVDLGFGNTIGTKIVNKAMNETRPRKQRYEENISDIVKYVANTDDPEHRFNDLTANPAGGTNPEMWMLSTSVKSAMTAARLGVGYVFGLFPYASKDKMAVGREAIRVYRENFRPSAVMEKPMVMAAPFVVAADTAEEADRLAEALGLWLLGKDNFSEFDRMPSVETAADYPYTETDRKRIEDNRTRMIVGDKKGAAAGLSSIAGTLDVDELLIIPLIPGAGNRAHALDLIASELKISNN